MKNGVRWLILAMVLVFVCMVAEGQDKKIIQMKPDYVPVIEVSQNPNGSYPVGNGGSYTNGPAYARVKVANKGTLDCQGTSKVTYSITLDGKPIKSETKKQIGGIQKGSFLTVLDNFKMEGLGKWKIVMTVDVDNEVAEAIETNNSLTFSCLCQKLY